MLIGVLGAEEELLEAEVLLIDDAISSLCRPKPGMGGGNRALFLSSFLPARCFGQF